MDFHGILWIIIGFHWLTWIKCYHRLLWIVMVVMPFTGFVICCMVKQFVMVWLSWLMWETGFLGGDGAVFLSGCGTGRWAKSIYSFAWCAKSIQYIRLHVVQNLYIPLHTVRNLYISLHVVRNLHIPLKAVQNQLVSLHFVRNLYLYFIAFCAKSIPICISLHLVRNLYVPLHVV